jgi:integrase
MQTVQPIKDRGKIEAMKKILRASSLRNELLFVLGINTGLRISDILSLTIADVLSDKQGIDLAMIQKLLNHTSQAEILGLRKNRWMRLF